MLNFFFLLIHREKFQIAYLFPAVLIKRGGSLSDVTCQISTDGQTYIPFAIFTSGID